ncbi:hypothetical protein A3F27_00125 [Candidatus Kaiserbacteria bacterium RIFCSPHIGHO2_12_FULL_53_13]|uniref:DoxX family protein n=1 Tax=Candidatus Kaiserbacteria bacterium RIFCSPHIGHO2_12_FULL_53_13 TaxID=1798502 RepID=A0A1F6EC59_9BACT|nr:MAG: hypothetical protein A3F27_00125 [Candidatus Kaiserbacteria bacterium RIFCSPHIGHO2_12_FULL_53_13]OGG74300.1 MAG: hypothetical protein A3A37_03190 [Candidatus Kaiserbacteria bacterium RIFCSPLOWO2_01_FULL_52_36]
MNSPFSAYAPVVLRFALSALFLWFGLSQITNPAAWIAWVPEWTISILGLNSATIVLLNGGFETIFGILLAVGIWTRWVALLLALHLFFIAYEVGYNDTGIRDLALAISTLAVSLFGPDKFTLDDKRKNI